MKLRRLSLVAFALLLVAGAAAAADETERFQRTVPLAPGGTLKLNNFSGHVTITGTDRSEVVIDAVRRAPRERLDRIKLDVQASGSTVRIQANKKVSSSWWDWRGNNVVETDMEIQVPRHGSPKAWGLRKTKGVWEYSQRLDLFRISFSYLLLTFG